MRVLFLSDTPFLPPAAGNRVRIEQMVAYLAAGGHEVAMLMLPAVDRPGWDVDGMRARLAWLEIVQDGDTSPAWRRTASRLATVAERLTGRDARPIGVDAWCPPGSAPACAPGSATGGPTWWWPSTSSSRPAWTGSRPSTRASPWSTPTT